MILYVKILMYMIGLVEMKTLTVSKETTIILKALLPIIIVFHHLSFKINILQHSLLLSAGAAVVSIFFYMSGYGLYKSLSDKKDYLKCFIPNRLGSLLVPYFICIIIYQFFCLYSAGVLPLTNISDILSGNTNSILPASWFVVVIFFLYGMFWWSFQLNIERNIQLLVLILLGAIFVFVLKIMNFPSYWFNCLGAFFLGIIHAFVICQQNSALRNLFLLLVALVSLLAFLIKSSIGDFFFYTIYPFFVVVILEFLKIGRFSNIPILHFLSMISYEIYLTHVIVYRILRCDILYIYSDSIYVILCFILTFAVSYIIMISTDKIKNLWILKQ